MEALIAGAVAYGFGADPSRAAQAAAIAALMAAGVFYLLLVVDSPKDSASGNRRNPIAGGRIPVRTGLVVSMAGFMGGIVWALFVNNRIILLLAGIIFAAMGTALRIFDPPILRAASLGALNGLYALIGGLAAGPLEPAMVCAALFLAFAMTGGCVARALRDLHYDNIADILTIPRKYGPRRAMVFLVLNELAAYLFALAAYLTGALGPGYLCCVLAIVLCGMIVALNLVRKPDPETASLTGKLSHGILGTLFLLSMVLGRK